MNNNKLEDYIKCIHSSKGRLRFRLTAFGIKNLKNVSEEQRDDILGKINNITGITKARTNPIIASITILYDTESTNESSVISELSSVIEESFNNKN